MKVTIDTIKHPESLGARKRERLVSPLYPTLPSTTEVTVEDSNNKTLEWVNNNKEKAVKIDTEVAMSMNPPDYEQSEKIRKNIGYNDHSGGANQHPSQDAPPTYNRNQPDPVAVAPSHHQAGIVEKGGVPR